MGDRREIEKNPTLDDYNLRSFYSRVPELELGSGSYQRHHGPWSTQFTPQHTPKYTPQTTPGHTPQHTPTRQFVSLENERTNFSPSGQKLKPSRFSYKSPTHVPYGDYSLPPDLSNGRQNRRRREQERIECVRVKAGEIRKERVRPSSLRSGSIRNSKSSDDNSIPLDLNSLCDNYSNSPFGNSNSRLGNSSSRLGNGHSRLGNGPSTSVSSTTCSNSDQTLRLPSQSFSEPCTPYESSTQFEPCTRYEAASLRTRNGDPSNSGITLANQKNLNVAFSKNGSKVRIDLGLPEPVISDGTVIKATNTNANNKARTTRLNAVPKNDPEPNDGGKTEVLTVLVLSLVKLVDVGLHGFMLGILLYCTYLSAVYCQQAELQGWHDTDICDKNSSLAPQLMNKSHWKMSVRDWSLIFCIFHCAYFLLAFLADLTFYTVIHNINKYVLTVFPVERGFLAVLLITDSILLIFSKNLDGVMETEALSAIVILATLCIITDTYFVLPRLRYLAKLDLGWLAKSAKFFSWWRPASNLSLVIVLVLYNLITAIRDSRMSIEVIPITVFGIIYMITILILIIFVCKRRTRLKEYLQSLPQIEHQPPWTGNLEQQSSWSANLEQQQSWSGSRAELFLGALGLVSLNYLSIAPVAKPVNFILTNLWLS